MPPEGSFDTACSCRLGVIIIDGDRPSSAPFSRWLEARAFSDECTPQAPSRAYGLPQGRPGVS
jgi:hypothetical protein